MKNPLPLAFGIAAGDAIYQVVRHGLYNVDWLKVGFMFVFCALVLAVVSKLRSPKAEK
jgi:hypothetical protein